MGEKWTKKAPVDLIVKEVRVMHKAVDNFNCPLIEIVYQDQDLGETKTVLASTNIFANEKYCLSIRTSKNDQQKLLHFYPNQCQLICSSGLKQKLMRTYQAIYREHNKHN